MRALIPYPDPRFSYIAAFCHGADVAVVGTEGRGFCSGIRFLRRDGFGVTFV